LFGLSPVRQVIKLQDVMYVEFNVPWSRQVEFDDISEVTLT